MHEEDKFGRGPHLHTADDLHGSPLEKNIRYNQHVGHIPENHSGITDILVTKNQRVINSIITNSQLAEFFACITLTGWDDALEMGSLKPNILFTRRKKWLLSNLNLKRSGVPEENLTKDYLSSISAFNFKALTSDGFDNNKRVYVIADLNSTL